MMIQVNYPVEQHSSWWKPLCMGVVQEAGWGIHPGRMGVALAGPVLTLFPPENHGLTREELLAKAQEIADACADVLYRRQAVEAAASLEHLRSVERQLHEAKSLSQELLDAAKKAEAGGKWTVEAAETATKLAALAVKIASAMSLL